MAERLICSVPEYALPYLVNGDGDSLTEEDLANVEKWKNELTDDGKKTIVRFSATDDRNEFNGNPAFGLACATVECIVDVK